MFIKFSNSKDSYVFPASLSVRSDVAGVYKDGQNLQNSGFYGTLNNKMKHGNYKVFLILVNGNNYAEVNSGKTIDL